MGATKHLVEQTLAKLRRVDPVPRLEFLPEDLDDVGGFTPGVEQNIAPGGFIKSGQAVEYRGFSRAVRPDKGGDRAALHLEINVV